MQKGKQRKVEEDNRVSPESLVSIGDEKMNILKKIWAWIRRMAHLYEKEIKDFVDEMLELAFLNIDKARIEKITPAIRKKIANKVLADILIMGIDIGTIKGKSEVGKLVMDAIGWFTGGDE